jgi:hypothetical protein
VQKDRVHKKKENTNTCKKMVSKIKHKLFHVDYQKILCRQPQNLKQKKTYVQDYIEEFFKLSLKSRLNELEYQRVERCVNGLKF